ncbi:MAG: hypothetical protein ACKVZH_06950 [Blastocatellia bacterium]
MLILRIGFPMFLLTTYIFDPPPEEVVFALAIFFVPAAILWGIARSKTLAHKSHLLVMSLAFGFGCTGMLLAFSIFAAMGNRHYRFYDIDPLFWLTEALGIPVGFACSIISISLASFAFLKYRSRSSLKSED